MYRVVLVPNIPCTARFYCHCNNSCSAHSQDHHGFEDEEPLEFVRRDEEDWELNAPEDEVRQHLLRRDACRFGEVVRDVEIARPDRSDHLRQGCGTGICLNSMPEEGCDHAGHHGEARK